MQSIESILSALEGTEHLLYSDPNNPYESITIRARISGGAISGCGTSTNRIYLTGGSAIYGNTAGDDTDLNFDYTFYWAYYGYSDACMTASVSPYMFNGTPYNWTDAVTGERIPEADLAYMTGNSLYLRADPGDGAPTSGDVVFTGNSSGSRGGAIGTNGTVIIGEKPEPGTVTVTPQAGKILMNGDMEEGQKFIFSTYLEKYSSMTRLIYSDHTDYYYQFEPEEPLGSEAWAADAKADTKTAIAGLPSYSLDVTAEDMGKMFTLLVVEDTTSSGDMAADESTYLEFRYAVGLGPDGKLTAYLQRVGKGVYERGEDGTPNFSVNIKTYSPFGKKYVHRITEQTDPEQAVFVNTKLRRDYSVTKKWQRTDGSNTPPEGAGVELELFADGEQTGSRIILDGIADEDGEFTPWTATWKDLEIYRGTADGDHPAGGIPDESLRIEYSVKEISVSGADRFEIAEEPVVLDGSDLAVLTNREKAVTERTVRKEWDDDGNRDGMRPQSIRITLTANGTRLQVVTLSDENGWQATVRGLPVENDGVPVKYAWSEPEITNYRQVDEKTTGKVTVFTNRLIRTPGETPPDTPTPKVPGRRWRPVIIEDYSTALGGEILINHVGDCFD